MQKTKTLFISGPSGQLEALITEPEDHAQRTVAIICHPNPTQAGTMHNKVVTTISRAFEQLGVPTVRFNYRGVGKSDGSYGHVVGEIDDLKAVMTWVQQQWSDYAICLAGFSFGSFIAASVANVSEQVTQLITVAPAVDSYDFSQLTQVRVPWLVIASDADEVVPFSEVQPWLAHPPSPIEAVVVHGASHFFHGRLIELRELIKARLVV